jgi:hypothetical protein
MDSLIERRKYLRIETGDLISVGPVDRRDRLAVSKNLSTGGIRFEVVGFEVDLNEVLRITFNVGGHTVVAVGRVAWAIDVDPITLDVGIEFVDIDPRALRLLQQETAGAA